jgi:hypothetical protein
MWRSLLPVVGRSSLVVGHWPKINLQESQNHIRVVIPNAAPVFAAEGSQSPQPRRASLILHERKLPNHAQPTVEDNPYSRKSHAICKILLTLHSSCRNILYQRGWQYY